MSEIMLNRQRRLLKNLDKEFYTNKELMDILGMTYEEVNKITKKLSRDRKKGFNKLDIILAIMGGVIYQTM